MLTGDLNNLRVNFLLGPGRCGTTLLMLMLNEHRNVISTPELKHLLYFYPKYKDINEVTPDLKKDISRYFNEWFASGRLKVGYRFKLKELLDSLQPGEATTFANVCKKIYLAFDYKEKELESVTAIFDKNPYFTLCWEKLPKVYPDTQFLLMLRDYRAYASSNYFSPEVSEKRMSVYYYAMVWKFYEKKVDQILRKYPDKTIFINYENLVLNPDMVLENVFSFFRLPPDTESARNFHLTASEKIRNIDFTSLSPYIKKKIDDLAKPVNKGSLANWKSKLSERQIRICEFVCGKAAVKYGYEPIFKLSATEKFIFTLSSAPSFLRVWLVFQLKSVKLHHYLNVIRQVKKESGEQK